MNSENVFKQHEELFTSEHVISINLNQYVHTGATRGGGGFLVCNLTLTYLTYLTINTLRHGYISSLMKFLT